MPEITHQSNGDATRRAHDDSHPNLSKQEALQAVEVHAPRCEPPDNDGGGLNPHISPHCRNDGDKGDQRQNVPYGHLKNPKQVSGDQPSQQIG